MEIAGRILIVDDVKENIKILFTILRQKGYSVEASMDGYDALKKTKKEEFDLILLDVMMPAINGFEVCRYLKADEETAKIPVIFLTASDDKKILEKAFRVGGSDYIRKPYVKEELLSRVQAALRIRHYEKNLEEEVQRRTKELEEAQIHLMRMLGGIAEGHSVETYQHVRRVSEVAYLLAKKAGMQEQEALMLKYASYLHDIGKIGIKDHILHKKEQLSKKEFDIIKKHSTLGAAMLDGMKLPLFEVAKTVALEHHEKYDGSGYPNGIAGENIHIYARIVAIADVFDALLSKRSYKEHWGWGDTLAYFQEMKGKHFDPKLIDLMFENIDEFLAFYNTSAQEFEQNAIKLPQKQKRSIFNWLSRRG